MGKRKSQQRRAKESTYQDQRDHSHSPPAAIRSPSSLASRSLQQNGNEPYREKKKSLLDPQTSPLPPPRWDSSPPRPSRKTSSKYGSVVVSEASHTCDDDKANRSLGLTMRSFEQGSERLGKPLAKGGRPEASYFQGGSPVRNSSSSMVRASRSLTPPTPEGDAAAVAGRQIPAIHTKCNPLQGHAVSKVTTLATAYTHSTWEALEMADKQRRLSSLASPKLPPHLICKDGAEPNLHLSHSELDRPMTIECLALVTDAAVGPARPQNQHVPEKYSLEINAARMLVGSQEQEEKISESHIPAITTGEVFTDPREHREKVPENAVAQHMSTTRPVASPQKLQEKLPEWMVPHTNTTWVFKGTHDQQELPRPKADKTLDSARVPKPEGETQPDEARRPSHRESNEKAAQPGGPILNVRRSRSQDRISAATSRVNTPRDGPAEGANTNQTDSHHNGVIQPKARRHVLDNEQNTLVQQSHADQRFLPGLEQQDSASHRTKSTTSASNLVGDHQHSVGDMNPGVLTASSRRSTSMSPSHSSATPRSASASHTRRDLLSLLDAWQSPETELSVARKLFDLDLTSQAVAHAKQTMQVFYPAK
jgi:hypothetical protein